MDICYCASPCDNKECIRNATLNPITGIHTFALLKDTEYCPTTLTIDKKKKGDD